MEPSREYVQQLINISGKYSTAYLSPNEMEWWDEVMNELDDVTEALEALCEQSQ